MITFVDTNILLDVFLPDPEYGEKSARHLEKAFNAGSLVINEIVYAELVPHFNSQSYLDATLAKLGIRMVSLDRETGYKAGIVWKQYRKSGGRRDRIISDFLIGAHAQVQADRLLTRDRGFYRKYFKTLKVIY